MDTAYSASVTVNEAAEILGVSARTVWRYIKAGRLEGSTIGDHGTQRTLICADSLAALKRTRSGGEIAEIRAERDRLAERLAAAQDELGTLRRRVTTLQNTLTRCERPNLVERTLGGAIAAWTRVRVGKLFAR